MEAKEKAIKLVKEFAVGGWGQKHAMRCVDEIIDTAMTGYLVNDSAVAEFQLKMRNYWKEVKNEIEKL